MAISYTGLKVLVPSPDQSGQAEEATEREINIDIIAVPGLGADPARSFGSKTPGGFNWLTDEKDGIRYDIPTARVLLYHYDSRWMGKDAKPQTLLNVANLLLDSLVETRKDSKRPLIFLGHSMGGLVVAKALTLAAARPGNIEYMRISECFAGGIFFGTPFRGSSTVAKAMIMATLLETVNMAIPTQMLKFLEPGHDSLDELRNDFVDYACNRQKAKLMCFYEEQETNFIKEKFPYWVWKGFNVGPKEMIVTEASARLDGVDALGLSCNHRELNRFEGIKDDDGRYRYVRHHLKNIAKSSRTLVKAQLKASRQSAVDDSTFQGLYKSLNVVDIQRKRRNIESLGGDSNWILKEDKFQQWSKNVDMSQALQYPYLWVSGYEGLGKSKAAATSIGELEKLEANNEMTGTNNVIVAYFFCDSTPDCSTAESVLMSLIWQLIVKRRSLAQYVKTFAAQTPTNTRGAGHDAEGQFRFSKLWKGLTEMLRDPSVQEVYFVINNLHHLSDDHPSTAKFMEAINAMITEPSVVEDPIMTKARWMFLSRDNPSIRDVLDEGNVPGALRIDMNDTSKSKLRLDYLRSFTREKVQSLAISKNYSLALQYFVFSSLEKKAQSTTLWVEVVCRLLEGLPADFIVVRKTLELLPDDVEKLIHRTWSEELNAHREDIEITKEILRTLIISYEDPTLDELCMLVGFRMGIDFNDSEDQTTNIQKRIKACGPLVKIYGADSFDDEPRVSFIHELARDALLKPGLKRLIGLAGEDDDKTEVKWQHGIVGLRCFSYVLEQFGSTDSDLIMWEEPETTEKSHDEAEIDDLFPEVEIIHENDDDYITYALEYGLKYPLKYWLKHGYEATSDFFETLNIENEFWSLESPTRRRWWGSFTKMEDFEELTNMTALHTAAFFGLLPLADALMANGHEAEIRILDSWNRQPLHWAAAGGYTRVRETFLKTEVEADINSDGEKSYVRVCEKLLKAGADINNGRETKMLTPLHVAASCGRLEIVRFLIEYGRQESKGVDINAVADGIGTPLALAISQRQTKAASLLLEYEANTTLAADDSEPPVAIAVLGGHEDLVKKLLQKEKEPNLTSVKYGTALAAAASTGNVNVFNMLFELDKDPDSCQLALKAAASSGFPDVVEVILESSTELECDMAIGEAARFGHDHIVKTLWNHRGDNVLSVEGVDNALYMATDEQHESTVDLLLEQCGANANAVGEAYGNALTAAASDGSMEIMKTLIKHGADIDTPEGYPLQAAAQNGHADIVELLLNHGAKVNAFSSHINSGTALQEACVVGDVDVARILLKRDANPDLGSGDFTNPLTAATSQGYSELVKLLLEAGANPNVSGGSDGSTPLINAAMALPSESLDLLIRHRAVVDQKDPDGDTALIISALVDDHDCVKLLLDRGADTNLGGKHYGSALHAAASNGSTATCQLLLERGADPNIHGGPFNTVLQAAAASGNPDCLKVILDQDDEIDIDTQGGDHSTAVHAAAVQNNDVSLRQLLAREPDLNIFPPPRGPGGKIGTPLQAAAFAGCNRNARLLLEAGADPNVVSGKHGTALQAAALKCDLELCEALLEKGARVDGWHGKYGSPLVACVARGDDEADEDRHGVLNLLLQQEGIQPQAYRAALEMALKLQRKEDFKLILTSMTAKAKAAKGAKSQKFPNIKQMLVRFKKIQHNCGINSHDDENSDFGEDVIYQYQDIYSEDEEEYEDSEIDEESKSTAPTSLADTIRAAAGTQRDKNEEPDTTRSLQRSATSRSIGAEPSGDTAPTSPYDDSYNQNRGQSFTGDRDNDKQQNPEELPSESMGVSEEETKIEDGDQVEGMGQEDNPSAEDGETAEYNDGAEEGGDAEDDVTVGDSGNAGDGENEEGGESAEYDNSGEYGNDGDDSWGERRKNGEEDEE
ncbi:hypothetical protein G7Z17_g8120 [Cylindrodendrum hubeiense]|uniref:Nephrocystin 3-like N-terminal domain-containing protein n=1 Tax=Cylindrodendrum hubeiense TaxID=595255 RepID=A0A9P5H707_9HYPO|nr:hypothetical protein G7Z17_g8120 [Cylindrodendrum hubeiense]